MVLNIDVGYAELIYSAVFSCVLHVITALAAFIAITAAPPANGGQHSNNNSCGAVSGTIRSETISISTSVLTGSAIWGCAADELFFHR
jgi:hypothetical protein